ncbi:MAG TPA: hypothetical protein VM075_05350 [Anaerolineae bacterium]|nr:hypothetical protein [Anaerolineae bacterium]
MTKLEYGDLYKFLVSLGILLICLSLVVPWLCLRESLGGLLKASEISELTPTAQALLDYRLQAALWFVRNVWWISLTLMIGGLLTLVRGIVLWGRKQRLLDHRVEIETEKLGLEVERLKRQMEPLTPGEIAINAIGEITEELEAEEPPEPAIVHSLTAGIQEYLREEKIFFDKLVTCYGSDRVLTHQGARDAAYDAILISDSPVLADVVFEVKRLTRHLSLDRLRAAVDQVSRLIQDYAVVRGRSTTSVVGILMFVVPQDDRDSVMMQEYLGTTKDQAESYRVKVHPIFITEQELREITCGELRAKIDGIAALVP